MELKVLLVEDEALIALMAQDMIEGLGHEVAHMASTLKEALDACALRSFDCALLDVNLNGDSSMPVAVGISARSAAQAAPRLPIVMPTPKMPRIRGSSSPDTPVTSSIVEAT